MTRYAKKVDRNHVEIRDGLRALGWEVYDFSGIGGGLPDLGISIGPGLPYFLEIKDGKKPLSRQALTAKQEEWHRFAWRMTSKVRNLDEAIAALNWAKERTS